MAGGRLYEQRGESELLWYSVLSITPKVSLDLIGHCTADYGGPSTSQLSIRLAAGQGGTQLSIRDPCSDASPIRTLLRCERVGHNCSRMD